MYHAVLYPAHKQLRLRFIAGETADVVTDVKQPGKAHAQPHADVIAQRIPVGAVIAAPGLDVALHPGAAGARDEIRALFRRKALLGFHRGAHHQQRHHRANMLDGDFAAKAVAARFAVPHLILVIIVPGRVYAHLQQLAGDPFLPPGHGLRIGEVEVRSFIVPEAGALRSVGLRIANEKAALRHLAIARMVLQQAGFDIGGQLQPGVVKRLTHHFWLRHLVVVPVKDVALAVNRGIAG